MSAELKVATFNIRYGTAPDGANEWRHRRDAVRAQLESINFDVCGLQEVLLSQRDFLATGLADTRWYGVGRTDGNREGEQSPVGVRGDRFRVEGWKTIWLSERPDVVGASGWDAKIPRVATVLLGALGDMPVGVVNTHLDHRGRLAQVGSARLIADLVRGDATVDSPDRGGRRHLGGVLRGRGRLAPFGTGLLRQSAEKAAPGPDPAEHPRRWIVMGDFNVGLESPAVSELQRAGLRSALPDDAGGTFHAWSGATDRRRIDHILVDSGWDVLDSEILHDRPGGRLPSDHWPVTARLRLAHRPGSASRVVDPPSGSDSGLPR